MRTKIALLTVFIFGAFRFANAQGDSLFVFDRAMSSKEVEEYMDMSGYRPAELSELKLFRVANKEHLEQIMTDTSIFDGQKVVTRRLIVALGTREYPEATFLVYIGKRRFVVGEGSLPASTVWKQGNCFLGVHRQ